tara:strand:+ start:92 stop:742 length:651 start_codon:yes stop_codon:yes gene_type:complete
MSKLTPELLLRAYAIGLFPMAEHRDDPTLFWIDPEKRGILPLNRLHVSRRLRRTLRSGVYDISCNTVFTDVVRACAAPGPNREDTWINDEIVSLYGEVHALGRAHCVETWRDGKLVGGLYGVSLGGAFFGESMFSSARDASKVALVHLVARLIKSGYTLLDTQFVTGHLTQFGVVELPRARYRELLSASLDTSATFDVSLSQSELETFLQSITQTS